MAKKKFENQIGTIDDLDAYMDSAVTEAIKEYGAEVYTGDEAEKRIVVIPVPAFSIRYLLQVNGYPLSRMAQLFGQEGSCKSSLLYEIIRWHRRCRGKGYLLEAETKDSPALRKSILEYDAKACQVIPCKSIQDWQSNLTHLLNINQDLMDKGKGELRPIGRTVPVCYGIDSLTGKTSETIQDKINEEGHAMRAFPEDALLISQYMKTMPQKMENWPFSVVGTNHLKPGQNAMGLPVDNIGGGMSLKFQETYGIKMQRIRDIDQASGGGIVIKMTTSKNSLGVGRQSIEVALKWTWERNQETNEVKQITWWDWYSASISKLLEFKPKGEVGSQIREFIDIHETDKKHVWSKTLDIPKDDPQTFDVAGHALEKYFESNPDNAKLIYGLLGIKTYRVFEPGTDLREQYE